MSIAHYGQSHVPLTPAVRAGDFVFASGQVPVDAAGHLVQGDVQVQTRQVLENLAAVLATAGCGLQQVVKTLVVLTDAADFPAFNAAYREYFPQLPPARTTLAAQLMIDAKVEIEAIAYAPQE
ncbi:RidA family protein [Xanthomonas sacchari]|uniref:RidA family protein n=1 Tax=Xanthomonas sacchari TaxID=56458 RepID=UPI0020C2E2E0|nr:RidA family protein [Xanthomonas sacchari]